LIAIGFRSDLHGCSSLGLRPNLIVSPKGNGGWRVVTEDSDVRLLLAVGFSCLFAITVLAAFIIPFLPGRDTKATWETVKEILSVLLPAQTGLLGSVLGFYFGSKANTLVAEKEPPDVGAPSTQ
jgi:hypothetical protein